MSGRWRTFAASSMAAVVVVATVGTLAGAPAAGAAAPRSASAVAPASASPAVPFITGAAPEGLGVLVNWDPDPITDDVSGYSLTAAIAPGFVAKTSASCASPAVVTVPGTDSSALIGALCARVPYVVTMTASNSAGTSAPSAPSNPAVPLVAQPPASPVITSVSAQRRGTRGPLVGSRDRRR